MNTQTAREAKFSIFSIIALVCAVLSFTTGAVLGMVLAGIAIVCGIIGIFLSLSSTTRGGLLSIFALIAGVVGVIAAIFKAVAWLT
jgi:hypothetical protein